MSENQEIIRQLLKLANSVHSISFPDLVQATTGKTVIPLDFQNKTTDNELFITLQKSARDFVVGWERRRQRFQGNRVNEVGRAIEDAFVQELRKTEINPELMGKSGYPDLKITQKNGTITYLESKTISKGWDSSFRSFYYKNGSKINSDAHHLLIAWDVAEERDKYWKINGWKICDLYHLRIGLKLEFNSSNKDIYNNELLLAEFNF